MELDPNFARAYASLGTAYLSVSQFGQGVENYRKAFELRDRVSERERYYIEGQYYSMVKGEIEKSIQTYTLWAQSYPADDIPANNLGFDFPHRSTGQGSDPDSGIVAADAEQRDRLRQCNGNLPGPESPGRGQSRVR